MANLDKTIRDFAKTMQNNGKPKTTPYDTPAEVVRIEGDIVWVHISGGVDETPVKKTIDAKKGDIVQVRVSGGTAYLIGNASAPPTDDTTAELAKNTAVNANINAVVAKKTAEEAKDAVEKTEQHFWTDEDGAHVTQISQADFIADPDNSGGNTLITSNGMVIRNGLTELAVFGERVRIGKIGTAQIKIEQGSINANGARGEEFFEVSSKGASDSVEIFREAEFINTIPTENITVDLSTVEDTEYLWNDLNNGDTFYIQADFHIKLGEEYSSQRVTFSKGTADTSNAYIKYYGGDEIEITDTIPTVPAGKQFSYRQTFLVYVHTTYTPFYRFGKNTKNGGGAYGFEEGYETEVSGDNSHACGYRTVAKGNNQFVVGVLNEIDNDNDYLFIVGNGVSGSLPQVRHNAFTVDQEGDITIRGHSSPVGALESVETSNYSNTYSSGSTSFVYPAGNGTYSSRVKLPAGRWVITATIRIETLTSGAQYGVGVGYGTSKTSGISLAMSSRNIVTAGSTSAMVLNTTHLADASGDNYYSVGLYHGGKATVTDIWLRAMRVR